MQIVKHGITAKTATGKLRIFFHPPFSGKDVPTVVISSLWKDITAHVGTEYIEAVDLESFLVNGPDAAGEGNYFISWIAVQG